MRSIYQHVVRLVRFAVLHFLNFLPDSEHHMYKVIQLGKAFALRRFYHQCAVNGEGEGRRVITVVHKAFGYIIFADARFLVYLAAFQYHFVSYETRCSAIDDTVGVFEAGSQIIGVQNGSLGGACQPFRTHHADIAVGDRQDSRTAEGSSRYLVGGIAEQFVTRQERNQMSGYADRTYARSATAMGRSECLVQVQVAHIGADKSGVGQTYLGVHVGAVHINLCAAGMDNLADFHDFRFKDAMGGRIGNH